MKKLFLFPVLAIAFNTACDRTSNCLSFNQEEHPQFIGSFESYGSTLGFYSENGDSLVFPLFVSQSAPYECTRSSSRPSAKDCFCEAHHVLSSNKDVFDIVYRTRVLGEQQASSVDIDLNILTLKVSLFKRIYGPDAGEISVGFNSGNYYSADTNIVNRMYNRVLVIKDLTQSRMGEIVLSHDKGIVGFKDEAGKQWHRVF